MNLVTISPLVRNFSIIGLFFRRQLSFQNHYVSVTEESCRLRYMSSCGWQTFFHGFTVDGHDDANDFDEFFLILCSPNKTLYDSVEKQQEDQERQVQEYLNDQVPSVPKKMKRARERKNLTTGRKALDENAKSY